MGIPVAESATCESRIPYVKPGVGRDEKILFSFSAIQRNEFFNLDGTCHNWASDLFLALQQASNIKLCDVYAGKYSGKTSPFRIHSHKDLKNPPATPNNVQIEDMWQIRISKSKGGVHGVFSENVFFIIWFDPQHNLYPDKNHGGLKKIIAPSTCCKDRDEEIDRLNETIKKLKDDLQAAEELLDGK